MSLRLIELLRPSLANFSLVTSSSLSPATSTSHSRNAYVEIVRFLPANAFKTCVNQLLEKKDFASAASLLLFLSNYFPTNLEYWTQAISMLLPLTSSSMRARQLLVDHCASVLLERNKFLDSTMSTQVLTEMLQFYILSLDIASAYNVILQFDTQNKWRAFFSRIISTSRSQISTFSAVSVEQLEQMIVHQLQAISTAAGNDHTSIAFELFLFYCLISIFVLQNCLSYFLSVFANSQNVLIRNVSHGATGSNAFYNSSLLLQLDYIKRILSCLQTVLPSAIEFTFSKVSLDSKTSLGWGCDQMEWMKLVLADVKFFSDETKSATKLYSELLTISKNRRTYLLSENEQSLENVWQYISQQNLQLPEQAQQQQQQPLQILHLFRLHLQISVCEFLNNDKNNSIQHCLEILTTIPLHLLNDNEIKATEDLWSIVPLNMNSLLYHSIRVLLANLEAEIHFNQNGSPNKHFVNFLAVYFILLQFKWPLFKYKLKQLNWQQAEQTISLLSWLLTSEHLSTFYQILPFVVEVDLLEELAYLVAQLPDSNENKELLHSKLERQVVESSNPSNSSLSALQNFFQQHKDFFK